MKRREAIRSGVLASSIGVLPIAAKSVGAFQQYNHPVEDAIEFIWNTDDRYHRVDDGPAVVLHVEEAGGLEEVCRENSYEYTLRIFREHPCWFEFNEISAVERNIRYHGLDISRLSDPPTIVLWEQGWPLWRNLDAEEEIENSQNYDSLMGLRATWCSTVDCR